ncbi:chemotaxis protein CheW [Roseomonas chloroacetimidivorans]|jgi:chemotaxis-related protein WspD|uniref:chemotaxis protein CheW n=1 Tax=Roseomonas chloroacetimidivorans TaxID=1766656 RepID=UPI003C78928C
MSMAPEAISGIDPCWQRIGASGDGSCPELRRHAHCRNCPTHASAASALLDRPPPEGYLAEWTGHVARGSALSAVSLNFAGEREQRAQAILSLMIFRLGGEWLALPATLLQEVAEPRPVRSLPHRRSGVVLGITNIHGEFLICVSLALLLGLDPSGETRTERQIATQKRLLVIGRDSDRFVFPADEVHGLHRCRADSLQPPPATISRAASSYTRQVLSWESRTVGCLDGDILLDSLNRNIT